MTRRRLVIVLLAAVLPVLAACGVGMPTSGDVVQVGPGPQTTRVPGISIDPRPPQPGASPTEIVQGFLDAMLATPTQTRSAQQFLTKAARTSWDPARGTIVYGEKGVPHGGVDDVRVDLGNAYRLDARGAWVGTVPDGERRLPFTVARENGQWRIASAPDALIVPISWFEARFTQLSLYFFDPTGQVLVPEPVFVPRGNQLATTLVRDLVAGPPRELAGVLRNFLPPGVGEGLSVPVDAHGTAEVALTAGPDQPAQSPQALTLLTAQLGWTLRQDPTVQSIRLSIGGRAVPLSGGRSEFSVTEGPEYDPAGYQTSAQMFGLDADGRLVSGQPPS
ncbi:GerMN domain-containing protein, partial [Nocardioides sp. CER28]